MKVEVTINVPEIHVFHHGSGAEEDKAAISEDRFSTRAEEKGNTLDAPPITDEETLNIFENRLKDLQIPQAGFGQDK